MASEYIFRHRVNFYSRGPIHGHRGEYKFTMFGREPAESFVGRQYIPGSGSWHNATLDKYEGWRLAISDLTPSDSRGLGFPVRRGWMGFMFERIYTTIERGYETDEFLAGAREKNSEPMVGLVKPSKRIVEIDPNQLRTIGIAGYEYGFKPLLAYAEQYAPFVPSNTGT